MYKENKYEKAAAAWRTLHELDFVRFEVRISNTESLNMVNEIIRHMDDFNDKDNKRIADTFKDFYESLPRRYFNEGNPNNGCPLFDTISLIGDSTIILKANVRDLSHIDISDISSLTDRYGEAVMADEHDVSCYPSDYGYSIEIRFWWD
jgi:hypothetical protein